VAENIIAHDAQRFTVRANTAERSYDVLDGATLVCFFPMTAAGYQQAYETCAELNYREAQDAALDVADEAATAADDEAPVLAHEAYLASLRQPGNVTRGKLVAHPDVQRQRHEVEGVMYVAWQGRPAGEAGIYADHLVAGAKGGAR
jgi:hypothetical protein